ncbi:hypothetical protein HPB51_022824 [Rhipicephalus microplus]|uniref:Uncharacterized protein n=1 Tax=Rhipicephalus microplus TaxID=6941 RepID=A0A9J6DCG4_RHIMP|nr:hypothetical protein HPB51_022824 [Rhipicephalus microplus]
MPDWARFPLARCRIFFRNRERGFRATLYGRRRVVARASKPVRCCYQRARAWRMLRAESLPPPSEQPSGSTRVSRCAASFALVHGCALGAFPRAVDGRVLMLQEMSRDAEMNNQNTQKTETNTSRSARVTATVKVEPVAVGEGLRLNPYYFKTVPGILKLIQVADELRNSHTCARLLCGKSQHQSRWCWKSSEVSLPAIHNKCSPPPPPRSPWGTV